MYQKNRVEVLQWSQDPNDYRKIPAASADTWEQGDFLTAVSGVLAKFTSVQDTTACRDNQPTIVGIAASGKKSGEIEATVCLKAQVLMTRGGTTATVVIGDNAVVAYVAASGFYTCQQGTAYNTDYEPDITLTLDFLTFNVAAVDADGRLVMQVSGLARWNAAS